jgi:hypothetical protein
MAEEQQKINVPSNGANGSVAEEALRNLKAVDAPKPAAKKAAAKKAGKKSGKKASKRKLAKPTSAGTSDTAAKKRVVRSFPASTFEDALFLAKAMQQMAGGQKVRRLTLFDHLKKSPDSGESRQLMTNSSRYGLTTGNHKTEYLELTPEGKTATSQEIDERQRLKARFDLAIDKIPPFKDLYEQLKGHKLPAQAVLRDLLTEKGYSPEEVTECVDTFILNAKFLGLLRPIAGAERVLPIEHVLEEASPAAYSIPTPASPSTPTASWAQPQGFSPAITVAEYNPATGDDWSKICFYITPIGAPGSPERMHSDLFLSAIVEPALEEFGLKVIRADQIAQPGLITTQIIEHVVKARLVVADLSYHNANVFYELCLRHACRMPTVQIIRVGDPIPFDLNQVRTIQIDTTSIYTLVPQLETYKSEIANQVRRALGNPEGVDNPLSMFYPNLGVLQETKDPS